MKNDYIQLFNERKWKDAFGRMPMNIPKIVEVQSLSDLQTIRVRASEYTKESADRRVSVSLDYDKKLAIVTVTKKKDGDSAIQ